MQDGWNNKNQISPPTSKNLKEIKSDKLKITGVPDTGHRTVRTLTFNRQEANEVSPIIALVYCL